MHLFINGVPTDMWYCRKHNEWIEAGDEGNCCARELEDKCLEEEIEILGGDFS